MLEAAYAEITEVMAGSSEDQMIVTVQDEDDNAKATLTAANAAADAAGDIIIGSAGAFVDTSGAAMVKIPVGKAVEAYVSQATSGGSPAGK